MFENIHPALKSLWDLENELRCAAQNALLMQNDEAKAHMEEVRRHYREALEAIRKELGREPKGHATAATEPERDSLAPTGPAKVTGDQETTYEQKHPHPGNVGEAAAGPMPTHDPDDKASQLGNEIEKKRTP